MMATGNTFTPKQLSELVSRLPLGDGSSGADYAEFFARVHTLYRDPCPDICAELKGQRRQKLALLLACIWAKGQVGEQNQSLVVKAAAVARRIMRAEGIGLDADDLMSILQQFRGNFQANGTARTSLVYARGHAKAAERLLTELERIGELEG
jgi:hypothetical protein